MPQVLDQGNGLFIIKGSVFRLAKDLRRGRIRMGAATKPKLHNPAVSRILIGAHTESFANDLPGGNTKSTGLTEQLRHASKIRIRTSFAFAPAVLRSRQPLFTQCVTIVTALKSGIVRTRRHLIIRPQISRADTILIRNPLRGLQRLIARQQSNLINGHVLATRGTGHHSRPLPSRIARNRR